MKTLKTTERKISKDGLKSYYVCAHNLKTAKYGLTLSSKYSLENTGAATSYKFDNLDEAIKIGDLFLQSKFIGIFAHKQFMKKLNFYNL